MLKLFAPLAIFLLTALAAAFVFLPKQAKPSPSQELSKGGIVNIPLFAPHDPYEHQQTATLAEELNLPTSPEHLFSQYDHNGDFQLSSEEFLKIDVTNDDLEMAFDVLDKDGNGTLSLPELYYAYRPKFH